MDPVLIFHRFDEHLFTEKNSWTNYTGQWGSLTVTSPLETSWSFKEIDYSNNSFRRCLWICRYLPFDFCYYSCLRKYNFNK